MPPIAILVALADPTRCRLIELLKAGPQPVHVLAAAFKISRPAISRHLRVLKQSGLISEKKFGRENRYALHAGKLAPVQRWLAELLPVAKLPTPATPPVPAAAPVAPLRARLVPGPGTTPDTGQAGSPALAAPAPARPAKPAAVSQMGFDF